MTLTIGDTYISYLENIMKVRTPQEMMDANLIVKHYAGSRAYGTSLPTSDVDFRGVFVADPAYVRTPFFTVKEANDEREEDTKIYELSQFMKLVVDCNPNVVETLWVDEKDVVYSTPAYQLLRQYAPRLLSSKIAFTTSGYALAQLKRIKGHNKWINQPQDETPPKQTDFISLVHNFTDEKVFKINLEDFHDGYRLVPFSGETFGLYKMSGHQTFDKEFTLNTFYEGDTHEHGVPLYVVKFNKTEYNTAKERWQQYWTWKKNRNVARSELEEKFGYDTKHAMHLVRLLRMGAEALVEGKLHVYRTDAAELLEIRNGAWSYEEVVEYAEKMDKLVREELYLTTKLPKKPDIRLAAELVLQVQDRVWKTNQK